MHSIFDVTLENYQDTVGEDAEKAAFIDPATLKNSDHIAPQFIYKYSVDETGRSLLPSEFALLLFFINKRDII